jgi:hypothetical protein
VLIVFAALQLVLGSGVLGRRRWAWIAGLVVSSLVIVTHIFYNRLLDDWAIGGLLTNILIVWILAAKEQEFKQPEPTT